jgi:hypothetical protein
MKQCFIMLHRAKACKHTNKPSSAPQLLIKINHIHQYVEQARSGNNKIIAEIELIIIVRVKIIKALFLSMFYRAKAWKKANKPSSAPSCS